jgi:transposase
MDKITSSLYDKVSLRPNSRMYRCRIYRSDCTAPKTFRANSYLAVLREQIPRTYEPGRIFMQDNARIHKAKKIRDWFEEEGIALLEWPPYSPDLNPIENLWAVLKEWINDYYPDLHNMGRSGEAYQRLFQAIREGLDAIWQDMVDTLIKSMDTRVSALIHAKGWYTRY